jgi:hypothetical protein
MKTGGYLLALVIGLSAQADDAGTIRDRLDKYLLDYEPQLSALVADERMMQFEEPASGMPAYERRRRELLSEVAFIALPGRAGWLGVRHVKQSDGQSVAEAPPLALALSKGSQDDYEEARALLAHSAAYNLGLPRTTNLPNLPLELLHPRNRERFLHRLGGRAMIGGVRTRQLVSIERMVPTIIKSPEGDDMESVVTSWIEPVTGRLLRAEVKSRLLSKPSQPVAHVLRVDFAPHPTLRLLVPVTMKENFPIPLGAGRAEARYTNYRRFETSARIVPQ